MEEGLRDIRPVVDVTPPFPWIWVIITALFLVVLWAAFQFYRQKRQQETEEISVTDQALERLQAINMSADRKTVYAELDYLARWVLSHSCDIPALEMTLPELMRVKDELNFLSADQRDQLMDFFILAEKIKFAPNVVSVTSSEEHKQLINDLVKSVVKYDVDL